MDPNKVVIPPIYDITLSYPRVVIELRSKIGAIRKVPADTIVAACSLVAIGTVWAQTEPNH